MRRDSRNYPYLPKLVCMALLRILLTGLMSAMLFLAAMMAITGSEARAATFTAGAGACGGGPPQSVSSGFVAVAFGPVICDLQGTTGAASSFAGGGGLGGFIDNTKVCCGTAAGAGAAASVSTPFMIFGDPGNVSVGLNLDLSSILFDLDLNPGTNYVVLSLEVEIDDINGYRAGVITSDGRSSFSGISPFGFGAYDVSVAPVLISTGFVHTLYISLSLSAAGFSPIGPDHVALDAAHTLTFNQGGPVFSMPQGYTLGDIPDLNLFNNTFTAPQASIPEPGSCLLIGAGLFALGYLRRLR